MVVPLPGPQCLVSKGNPASGTRYTGHPSLVPDWSSAKGGFLMGRPTGVVPQGYPNCGPGRSVRNVGSAKWFIQAVLATCDPPKDVP
jgi:hypothetical protein